jgi:hypothetical protein
MSENRWPVRIAVNVMRARLTVIGFNIAIVSFQIVQLYRSSGGIKVPGIDRVVHIGASMALYMALALSLIALVAFILSSAYDEVGVCTHWSMVAGDLLMYLGLAHTLAGFFVPLAQSIEIFSANLPDHASDISILQTAALVAGGTAWFLAIYAGPVVSLVRSPFQRRINIALGMSYVVVLLALCWVSAHAVGVEAAVAGGESGMIVSVLGELVQPFRW